MAFVLTAERVAFVLAAGLVCAALGWLMRWPVVEKDVFLFVRIGREILTTGRLPDRVAWSSVAAGAPYVHYQWLSSVLFAWAARGDQAAGLADFRAVLVALGMAQFGALCVVCASVAGRDRRAAERAAFAAFLLLAPVLLVIAQERLLLRPDLLVFALCFVPLVALLASRAPWRGRATGALALLVLWTNLHGGTAPFGILIAAVALAADRAAPRGLRARVTLAGALGLTWLASPIGVRVLAPFWQNAVAVDWAALGNLDYRALTPALFLDRAEGLSYPAWALVALLGVAACLRHREPDRRTIVFLGLGLAFLGLSVFRVRLRAYSAVLFSVPLVEAIVEWCGSQPGRLASVLAAAAVASPGLLAYQATHAMPAQKGGVSLAALPVRATAYLATVEPAPRPELFNEYDYGGYLLYGLNDRYRIAADGRALPFVEYLNELHAIGSPAEFESFLDRHRFNLALVRPAVPRRDPAGRLIDPLSALFPRETWALVFFDNAAAIFVRRLSENRVLIARDEYRELRGGRVATALVGAVGAPVLSPAELAAFSSELDRCLSAAPDTVYCLQAKAAAFARTGDEAAAATYLERARQASGL